METLLGLCTEMKKLQTDIDDLEERVKEKKAKFDELRTKKIPDLMEELELKTATFEGIGRVQLANDVYASTKEGKKDAAFEWLRDLGYDDMIQETYNMSTLKALFRKYLKDGVEIPGDIFNVTPFTRASIVKA
jgi:hypothetical protein